MIFTIAGRELRSLFVSPLAWAILAVVQVILAFLFLSNLGFFVSIQPRLLAMEAPAGLTDIVVGPLLGNSAVILILTVPLLTMRLLSEERRNRTLSLLFSAPVSMTEIVLGKYLGILFFLLILVGMIALMPLALLFGGSLDYGTFAASILGLILVLAAFAAVGLFMSSLSQHPAVAAVGTFGVLFLFWILDWAGQGVAGRGVFAYLSLLNHYEPFLKGVFDSADAIFYLLFIAVFLVLSIRRLDADRLGG